MKNFYFLFTFLLATCLSFGQGPIITAIVDGDCSGGNPKLLEIYADGMVDFSLYSLENQTNANTTWGNAQDLSGLGTVTDGFVYVTTTGSAAAIATEFPSLSTATILTTGTMNVNGDDRVRIILNSDSSVIDQYGVDSVDGSGQTWEYADSYAKRVDGTGPDGGFTEINWTIPGAGTLNTLGTCQGGADTFETLMGGIGTYSTTGSTTPTINTSGTVSGLFYFEGNGPSNEDSFNVSGINLTDDITVTAPSADFELSLTSGGTFTASVVLSQSGGTVTSTPVYVRLAAGLSANSYSGDATLTSPGATNQTVALSGLVDPANPFITISGGVPTLEYNFGNGPSAEDSFNVSGMFLTQDITVTAPANFEISLTSGSGFGSGVTVTQSGGTAASTEVFIRLAAGLAEGPYSGDVTATSTGATDEILGVNGNVNPAATCANVGDIIITEIMKNPSAVGDTSGEYFEVYNTTGAPIDMIGWVISDFDTDSHTITSSVVVPSMGYAVFGVNADSGSNGGVTVNYEYSGVNLANGTDEVQIECNAAVIDAVAYNDAEFPDTPGVSMELSTTAFDSVSNDTGSNWGNATNDIGSGDLGTPGGPNDFTLSVNSVDSVSFNMYPNPNNTGMLNINTSNNGAVEAQVFDILGKRVINTTVVNNTLDVTRLNSGLYIVKLSQDGTSITKKLVIE